MERRTEERLVRLLDALAEAAQYQDRDEFTESGRHRRLANALRVWSEKPHTPDFDVTPLTSREVIVIIRAVNTASNYWDDEDERDEAHVLSERLQKVPRVAGRLVLDVGQS